MNLFKSKETVDESYTQNIHKSWIDGQ